MGPDNTQSIANTPSIQDQRFEIGDEVLGDEHIRGTIIGMCDLFQLGEDTTIREYLVKSEEGARLVYASELNLKLLKKGLGDAAPPRPRLMQELEHDLRTRPLAGLRL